jgi:proline iminopeptidase
VPEGLASGRALAACLLAVLAACAGAGAPSRPPAAYHDASAAPDRLSGGARRIPIHTPRGTFWVWTKRVGENPRIKVLLLHGGPGMTHEYFEAFDSYFPAAGIEYFYYDQLGSRFSQPVPDDVLTSFLDIGHYVDEVEQVRQALGLDERNFFLLGHSWGGLLAIEYALAHPEHLKGLIVSNMMSSIPAYNAYAVKVLEPQMPPATLAEILALEKAGDYDNPRYEELLFPSYYTQHILRMPVAEWPDPVLRAFEALNKKVYIPMQGPSEMGASGILATWDRSADLSRIQVPTLVIGAQHDSMDPTHMKWMAGQFPRGRYLHCPNGGHLAMYDDQAVYMEGVVRFIQDVDAGRF